MSGLYESEFDTCGGCGRPLAHCSCGEEWDAIDWLIFAGLILLCVVIAALFLLGAWTIIAWAV